MVRGIGVTGGPEGKDLPQFLGHRAEVGEPAMGFGSDFAHPIAPRKRGGVEKDSGRSWEGHGVEYLPKKDPSHKRKNRNQNGQGEAQDITEKRWHTDFRGFGNRLDHEVGAVTDIGGGPEKDRT